MRKKGERVLSEIGEKERSITVIMIYNTKGWEVMKETINTMEDTQMVKIIIGGDFKYKNEKWNLDGIMLEEGERERRSKDNRSR